MTAMRLRTWVLVGGWAIAGAGVASAQDYPVKPIRIITAAAGGGSDFNARQVAQGISGPLGQPVVVDNRTPLAASEAVSKSPADGYTLMVGGDSLWTLSLLRQTPYDPVADFAPISLLMSARDCRPAELQFA
jgi:tripartite-type tricarboxylate transporter receptor subunit TctC